MGKIKKILENELVGGTQSSDVYPVTSTKAVYDDSNTRLDTVIENINTKLEELPEKEDVSNKSTVIDISADDIHYPTTKSVLNAVSAVENRKITPEMLSETTKQYIESSGGGTITNLADDEDLTSVDNVLKLADKDYSPTSYSGMGRVYLRKNMVDGKNILTQEMMTKENTIYIIQYDYDLNGATINVPSGCVLDFQGGSLANGQINADKHNIIGGLFTNCCVRARYDISITGATITINTPLSNSRNACIVVENDGRNDGTLHKVIVRNCILNNSAASPSSHVYEGGIKIISSEDTYIVIDNNHIISNNYGIETQETNPSLSTKKNIFSGYISNNYVVANNYNGLGISNVGYNSNMLIKGNVVRASKVGIEYILNTSIFDNYTEMLEETDVDSLLCSNSDGGNCLIKGNTLLARARVISAQQGVVFESNYIKGNIVFDGTANNSIINNYIEMENDSTAPHMWNSKNNKVINNYIRKINQKAFSSGKQSAFSISGYSGDEAKYCINNIFANNVVKIENLNDIRGSLVMLDVQEVIHGDKSTNREFGNVVVGFNDTSNDALNYKDRPSLSAYTKGNSYFDATLGKPIWWNGSAWVDSTGAVV